MTKVYRILLIILGLSFVIRIIGLNQSFWLDEATTANVISKYSYLEIIKVFSPTDFHPPTYYLFMKFWSSIFGTSEMALRLPSVIFSILSGYVIFLIGKKLKNEIVGLWSAVFFLMNPLIIYYSQEARMYLMVTFFLTVSFYYFIDILKNKKPRLLLIILFNLFIFLSFITFYGSVFLIVSFYIYILIKKKVKLEFLLAPGFILSVIILAPLLKLQFINSQQVLMTVKNWSLVLGKVTLKNLFLIPIKFSTGRISFDPKLFYYLLGVSWTIVISYFIVEGGLKNKKVLYFFVVPLLIGTIFSFATPLLQYFRFIYLIIFMSLLLGLALYDKKRWPYTMTVVFIIWSVAYLLNPWFYREDWKTLSSLITHQPAPVYIISSSADPLKYYTKSTYTLFPLESIPSQKPTTKSVLIIPYTADIHGVDYKTSLQNYGYMLKTTSSVRGIPYELWQKLGR